MSKRERGTNFNRKEKRVLLGLIREYYNIVENKKTDKISSKLKEDTWEEIARRHNASGTAASIRETKQLRTFYDNWRRRVRKTFEEASLQQTEGGPRTIPTLDDTDFKFLNIIQNGMTPVENPFDSNAITDENEDSDESSGNTYEFIFPELLKPKVVVEGTLSKVVPSPSMSLNSATPSEQLMKSSRTVSSTVDEIQLDDSSGEGTSPAISPPLTQKPSKKRRTERVDRNKSKMKTYLEEDEADAFGRVVSISLRKLPVPLALSAQGELQSVLNKYRLEAMKSMNQTSNQYCIRSVKEEVEISE
ncbi:hypothetical protein M8J76_017148 [Diaphorina citri]|nr:hypothetical protein M8J76_017148 [Diaphorina citri]KAI5756021.1 hypothetical protein M8J77_021427 [Diaphorina citri]